MVGLPARGKTFVARKIFRFLTWLGHDAKLFNAGDYRRVMLGAQHSHEFFSPDNAEGKRARLAVAQAALEDLFTWLRQGGQTAIYDATNTTHARRELIVQRCAHEGVTPLFVEILVNDEAVIERTIRETKVRSADYIDMDPDAAVADFRARIAHYASAYEPLGSNDGSYIKYIDIGRELAVQNADSELGQVLVRLLLNLRGARKRLWLTRHGESVYNGLGLIGGDPDLSPKGLSFAKRLARFVEKHGGAQQELVVWTSSLRRTIQTAAELRMLALATRELDEINAGVCDGKSYPQIEHELPDEFAARKHDKFRYRYPRGESYQDVIKRLLPVVLAFEHEVRPILVVGHQAVLRTFYSYLTNQPPEQCPHLSIPLHTVIELTPKLYDWEERRFLLD